MKKYQNLVGALAWIASRDADEADKLSDLWSQAEDEMDRVLGVIYLTHLATVDGLKEAKAELVAFCAEGRLTAHGYTVANNETRLIPETAWLNSTVDESECCILKETPTWLGLAFKTADLKSLWKGRPLQLARSSKKRTGPPAPHREAIARIWEMYLMREEKARALGEPLPPPLTATKIAKKLKIPERTARHNLDAIKRLGKVGPPSGGRS